MSERNKGRVGGEKEALTDLCQIGVHSFSLPFETGQVEARKFVSGCCKMTERLKIFFFCHCKASLSIAGNIIS